MLYPLFLLLSAAIYLCRTCPLHRSPILACWACLDIISRLECRGISDPVVSLLPRGSPEFCFPLMASVISAFLRLATLSIAVELDIRV